MPAGTVRRVRVLVTGASGFVGAHVARRLAEAGADVRGLSRSVPPEEARVADHVAADLLDADALARAVDGCEAVVHVAALYAYGRELVEIFHRRHGMQSMPCRATRGL